jgi:maltose alpha-D-glucosyltransferase/alpha-amylase
VTHDGIDRTRATRWLIDELPRAAVAWLPTRRWYGGKSQSIASVGVEDVFWLPDGSPEAALVVLDVASGDSRPDLAPARVRYTAVVAFAGDPSGRSLIGIPPGAPHVHVVEATADPQPVVALLRGLSTGMPVPGVHGGEILYADATDGVRRLLADTSAGAAIVPIGAEQSNTSVRVGAAHVFKLFRRLDTGEHPQLEFGRFLSRVGFDLAPPLEGSLTYRSAAGTKHALGALEGWIVSSGDGWAHVTSQLRRGDRTADPQAIADEMHGLGETTAAFHVALASEAGTPAFAPEPVTGADVAAWRTALVRQAERTRDLVERQHHQWTGRDADVAGRFLRALEEALPALGEAGHGLPLTFRKIRIHGDFHLGQTLKTREGFALIDFEGEPSKPLAARRLKQCALKDVAGMLRSLDYAWAAAAPAADAGAVAGDAASSLAAARAAFLRGYDARARRAAAAFLPPAGDVPHWTALFELEKALYEVEYEVDNRPAWVGIPLGAAVTLLRHWQRA